MVDSWTARLAQMADRTSTRPELTGQGAARHRRHHRGDHTIVAGGRPVPSTSTIIRERWQVPNRTPMTGNGRSIQVQGCGNTLEDASASDLG